jgi:sugar O-acyltransferase (sialic acid O-acetyltransferase NeuD family)
MRQIYILGSGGFSKEVFALIKQIGNYETKGFVDLETKPDIIISNQAYKVYAENYLDRVGKDIVLAIGVGDPKLIQKLANRFKHLFQFPNLIHPSVIGNFDDIVKGEGNIITQNCVFTTSIKIGSFNVFNLSTTVGHDVIIGDYNVINPAVNISGGVTIGNTNLIGVNATILQYKNIGNNSTVGASSLVTKDVEDNVVVTGIPAKTFIKA